jgi:hypothetical protein
MEEAGCRDDSVLALVVAQEREKSRVSVSRIFIVMILGRELGIAKENQ